MKDEGAKEKKKVVKRVVKQADDQQTPSMFVRFFSGTLWGVIGGIIIIAALYVSLIRDERTSVKTIHIRGNQAISSFEIGRSVTQFITRFNEALVPYPNRILQSSKTLEHHLTVLYPEIKEVHVNYDGFSDIYITVSEFEARIVNCNTAADGTVSCWQRSQLGKPLLKIPQTDFDINPKIYTSLELANNELPQHIAQDTLEIYAFASSRKHRVLSCTYRELTNDYSCLLNHFSRGGMNIFIDTASLAEIKKTNKNIIDIVFANIPSSEKTLEYIDLRFFPRVVYKNKGEAVVAPNQQTQ